MDNMEGQNISLLVHKLKKMIGYQSVQVLSSVVKAARNVDISDWAPSGQVNIQKLDAESWKSIRHLFCLFFWFGRFGWLCALFLVWGGVWNALGWCLKCYGVLPGHQKTTNSNHQPLAEQVAACLLRACCVFPILVVCTAYGLLIWDLLRHIVAEAPYTRTPRMYSVVCSATSKLEMGNLKLQSFHDATDRHGHSMVPWCWCLRAFAKRLLRPSWMTNGP